nr:deleted in malignant brain tumors 1 protein-like isoform X3 [Crassostrea gigas]
MSLWMRKCQSRRVVCVEVRYGRTNVYILDTWSVWNFTELFFRGLNCKWLFRSADTTLKLIFLVTEQVQCGDVLLAFDGTTMGDRRIDDAFCSPQTAPSVSPFYVTSSNQMLLSFITDSTTHAQLEKGFKVEILSARPVAYEAEACNSNIKTLVATKNEEVLTSPSFPENYKSNTNCFWNITSPTEDGTIRINVLFLDTDAEDGVCYDNITTYDGKSGQFKLLIFI